MLEAIVHDVRYALRMLRQTPGFTLVAVLTLALGIGANTTVFSLLNAALFREIKAPEPQRLVWLVGTSVGNSRFRYMSYPEYVQHRDQDSVFSGLMTYQDRPFALGSGGEPQHISGFLVTGNYFSVLGIRMQLGRAFLPEEDGAKNANPAVVLGDALWRARFGADSAIIGSSIVLNGKPFTVIGVAPRGFTGIDLGQPGAVWVTMAMIDQVWPNNDGILEQRLAQWLRVVGRLRPGVTLEAARSQARVVGNRLSSAWRETTDSASASVEPLAGGLDPNNRQEGLPIFALLMAVPAMVLLIACANAANLLLSRATARRREIGVRLALGATRGRLVRLLMTESLVLGIIAGGVAMLCSLWLTGLVSALGELPSFITDVVTPDGRVFAFTMTLGVITGLVFGLVPALGATRPNLVPALKGDGNAGWRMGGSRLLKTFVVAQVSVSLVLLVVAGLFLRTLAKATHVDAGFDPRNGITMKFDLGSLGYDAPRRAQFHQDLLERVKALPGITEVSLASDLPLSERMVNDFVRRAEDPDDADGYGMGVASVYPGFFRTMGIALVGGRDFTMSDDGSAPGVVIINQRLAERLWPGESPLGRRIRFSGPNQTPLEVVGVSQNGKYHELTEEQHSFLYFPARQRILYFTDLSLVARTAGDPARLLPIIREVIRGMDRNLPVYGLTTLEQHVRLRLDKERGASALLGAFGALALILATLGLYGVMAYSVSRRTRELGIRVALGAARGNVLGMVVGEGLKLAGVGIAIGLVLAAGLTRIIERFLFGVTPTDVMTFAGVAALLAGVAAAASWIPARRATRVDPMVALRAE